METMTQNAAVICGVMLAAELTARLCPKDKMLGFVKSLVVLTLLASGAAALLGAEWKLPPLPEAQQEGDSPLEHYVEDQMEQAAAEQWVAYLRGLLAAAGLEAKKILAEVDIGGESSIVLTKAGVRFRFESDAQRARALLENVLGPETAVEVTWDGA